MGNCYCTVDDLERRLGRDDAGDMLWLAEVASRAVDDYCRRRFYVETGTRHFGGESILSPAGVASTMLIDDVLSVSEVVPDDDGTQVYDTDAWVEGTDFYLDPANRYPKTRLELDWVNGSQVLVDRPRYLRIAGTWGYAESANPWAVSAVSVGASAVAVDDTQIGITAEGSIEAGNTIKIDDEQLFVTAVSSDGSKVITIERGVNGTTAATHDAGVAIGLMGYPPRIEHGTTLLAARGMQEWSGGVYESEQLGTYRYKLRGMIDGNKMMAQAFGAYVRADRMV